MRTYNIIFGLFLGMLIATLNPSQVHTPTVPNEIVMIQDNTLLPVYHIPRTQVLGVSLEEDYYSIISKYDWDAEIMYAILKAESSKNPEIINWKDYHKSSGCYGSFGLMQLGCVWFGKYGLTEDNWKDPETNIRVAYEVYKAQGLRAWGAYTDKSYLRFL